MIQATGFEERVVRGMLVNNPVIKVKALDHRTRIASFQKDYRYFLGSTNFKRRKPSQFDLINSHIKDYLVNKGSDELYLNDVVKHIEASFKFKRPTIYAAIDQSNTFDKITDNNKKILQLISKGRLPPFNQLNNITDRIVKSEAKKAISMLNLDTVDVALFQLGRFFENVLRKYMQFLVSNGSKNIKQSNIRNLNNMIAYIKKAGIVTDETVLSVLRTERNLRAHGIAPDEDERRLLLNSSKWIVDRYLDYIIFFERKMK